MNLRTIGGRLFKLPVFYIFIILFIIIYTRKSYLNSYYIQKSIAPKRDELKLEPVITTISNVQITPDKKIPSMLFMVRYTRDANAIARDPGLNNTINEYCPFKCDYTMDRKRLPTADGIFLQPSEINKSKQY